MDALLVSIYMMDYCTIENESIVHGMKDSETYNNVCKKENPREPKTMKLSSSRK